MEIRLTAGDKPRVIEVDIGSVCLEYGGGGHVAAGTCQIDNADATRVAKELIGRLGSEDEEITMISGDHSEAA